MRLSINGSLSDLPRRAEANVALHLFDRRGDPSFEAHLSKLAFASGGGHNRKYHIQQVWSLGGFGPIVIWTDA
jgi:hypothetical protein